MSVNPAAVPPPQTRQEPFTLTRAASRSKSSLALCVGGVELTKQEQRLTELELEARFSASLLPKTLVFTQEGLLSLLQVRLAHGTCQRAGNAAQVCTHWSW